MKNKLRNFFAALLLACPVAVKAQTAPPPPCGPLPSARQLRWQDMEMYAFIHYSLNTYTDQEWGFGNESPMLFNPSNLDCRQWARVCRQSGMRGIIFTAKHHCGFCMWPSDYTDYSVKHSPWKNGQGDVVACLAEACREEGLEFAVYLSPWDRHQASYGQKEYVDYFRRQLHELLTRYGPVFEVWFDGANGGDGWYGGANERRQIDRTTYYEWPETYKMIREVQPQCLIWNDGGDRGDLRWVGTEGGYVGETNWSLLNREGVVDRNMLHYGLETGDAWVPGETNTSIRPGWFYHESENGQVKSLAKLMDTYYKSVGRNSTLLLNFPVAPNGLIHPNDSLRGLAFARMIDRVFSHDLAAQAVVTASSERGPEYACSHVTDGHRNTYWATPDDTLSATLTLTFARPTAFNRFLAEEYIPLGQRVKRFRLEACVDGQWQELKDALVEGDDALTTIGHRRIVCFPTVEATQLRFSILDAKACPLISKVGLYLAPELAVEENARDEASLADLMISHDEAGNLVVDCGKRRPVNAFRYLPPQKGPQGVVTHYTLWASADGTNWQELRSGEFSNVVNNPVWQTVRFAPLKVRWLKLQANRLAAGERLGYDGVQVLGD